MKKVDLKLALALKAAGCKFKDIDEGWYLQHNGDGVWHSCNGGFIDWALDDKFKLRQPTYDQVCHYLREKKKLHISIDCGFCGSDYYYMISPIGRPLLYPTPKGDRGYKSYYACQLAAIKHALKLLS